MIAEAQSRKMIREVASAINSDRITDLNLTVQKLSADNRKLEKELSESQGSYIHQNRDSNNELIQVLKHKNAVIKELQSSKHSVEDNFSKIKVQLLAKDRMIEELRAELVKKQAEIDDIHAFKEMKETIEAKHAMTLAEHELRCKKLQEEIENIKAKAIEDERSRNANLKVVMFGKEESIRKELEDDMCKRYGEMETDYSRVKKELQFQGREIEQILSLNEQLKESANVAQIQSRESEEVNVALMKRLQWYKRQFAKLQSALESSKVTVPEFSEFGEESIFRDDITLSSLRSYSANRAAAAARAEATSASASTATAPHRPKSLARIPNGDPRNKLSTNTNFIVKEYKPSARGAILAPTEDLPVPLNSHEDVDDRGSTANTAPTNSSAQPSEKELESVYNDLESVLSARQQSKQVNDSIMRVNNFKILRAKEMEVELLRHSGAKKQKKSLRSSESKSRRAYPPASSPPSTKCPSSQRLTVSEGTSQEAS